VSPGIAQGSAEGIDPEILPVVRPLMQIVRLRNAAGPTPDAEVDALCARIDAFLVACGE
jgi:hypothetical protein